MTFKLCSGCKKPLNEFNTTIKTNGLGLWLTHNSCHSTSLMTKQQVSNRANQKANGNPVLGMEADYFKNRLTEINERGNKDE